MYLNGRFLSCHRQDTTKQSLLEKSITISLDDIYVSSEHLQTIRKELNNKEPAFGKFKIEEWTSTMLAQLNEASTHFFSGESKDIEKSQLRNEIKEWFARKWTKGGRDLLEQATSAILPDNLYTHSPPKEKVSESLRSQYNSYASTALILINEKSQECWKEMQTGKHNTFPKRETIKNELIRNSKFSVKLAAATAAIIRPDAKK
ncbi:hypothetical protein D3C81_1191480 [compost metagenome]